MQGLHTRLAAFSAAAFLAAMVSGQTGHNLVMTLEIQWLHFGFGCRICSLALPIVHGSPW
jgi:hypothetical protein